MKTNIILLRILGYKNSLKINFPLKISQFILLLFYSMVLQSCGAYISKTTGTNNRTNDTTITTPSVVVGTKYSVNNVLNIPIPTAGNAWVLNNNKFIFSDIVTDKGIRNWNDKSHTIRTYFYIAKPGKISLGIRAKIDSGTSKINVTFEGNSQNLILSTGDFNDIGFGEFLVNVPGYYFVEITGIEKDGVTFAEIDAILLGGANANDVKYIKDDFYFSRRGPSVHLNFDLPNDVDSVEWFYSELTVPKNQDVLGSYFMTNGFGEGYFGIQVNSPTERKILFSIWSPFETDNPNDVPQEYKIQVLKKGEGVITGEFGNEGSGGQSYKLFNWKSEVTYGFLVGAKPTGDGKTDYVAYFYDSEINKWNLIAQFRRPRTNTYLKHLYSFLENFIPEQGAIARKANYGNQWVYDSYGWHELTDITFTADNAARKEYRLDYSGGIENNYFYLKNCGFTNDKVKIESSFKRDKLNIPPDIKFSQLE